MKTKMFLTSLALALCATGATTAMAHEGHGAVGATQAPGARGDAVSLLDTDKNGTISKAEACAGPRGAEGMLCKNFAAIDANKDGQLSKDELGELRAALREGFTKTKIDVNGDGKITKAEACGGPQGADGRLCQNFDAVDTNKDGVVSQEEMNAARAGRMGGAGAGRLLDKDGNGAISKAEACGGPNGAEGKLCVNFAAIDTNKDGSLSKEELQAFRLANHPKRGH